ncbi:aminopeptidase P family protein [Bacillus luteolus]|uniref:Aminopeptidase P family protein n=1 Tax=Litchfieldia luteola TaxID=682179 RepID=A0ABR9QK23_9BACI|nr:M24 family metallopeptidase [Cytobacillus luteolus]MBE4908519.1 aminopeptidase P family protein [Cytobacillus luteolus]MBP1941371.1 Xaa-Pro aminopeptidase [Cytobacillus luteolus]
MISATKTITAEKLEQASKLLNEKGLDTWLLLTREGSDPALPLLVGIRSVHKAAIFIRSNGEHLALSSVSDKGSYESTKLFKRVEVYEASMEEAFLKMIDEIKPVRLALNISESDHLCDGLTQGLYLWLEDVMGKDRLASLEVSSEELLKKLRSVKTESELNHVQKAINYTTDIFEEVFQKMQCGMTELEIGQLFVDEMKVRGVGNGLGHPSDPPLVCIVRKGLAHRKPANHKTEPGDIVIIDFSLRYMNYVSDIARTCYFLKPGEDKAPEDIQKAFDTAVKAITVSIEELLPGKAGFEVDAAGRKVIEEGGYPTIRHSVGHQIGRATHDGGTILGPKRVPPRPEVEGIIEVGEIYAIEPTVIQDNNLPCILVEENVLVTEHEPLILSKRQTQLVLIPLAGN